MKAVTSIQLNGLRFHEVTAGTTILGTTKGGWIYGSQRPSHEVQLPEFFILKTPLRPTEVKRALGINAEENESEEWMELTSADLDELASHLMDSPDFKNSPYSEGWTVRPPSEGEWQAARIGKVMEVPSGITERLVDAPAANYRGAMMDGRPRPNEWFGPAAHQRAAVAVHPQRQHVTALGSVPYGRALPNVVGRLVLTPIREGSPTRVPDSADRWGNLRSELLWTTALGIVPSFMIPVLRGMGDYAAEGWLNLLLGGLCAGFFTGALWRPRRPVLTLGELRSQSSVSDSQ